MAITIEDVRDYMYDTLSEDNALILEQDFTDREIEGAMKSAAREWNSIPPFVLNTTDWRNLDDRTNTFFDGIAAALLRRELVRNARNEVTYKAGNMASNLDSAYIGRLQQLIPMFEERFVKAATRLKIHRNLNDAYGQVG